MRWVGVDATPATARSAAAAVAAAASAVVMLMLVTATEIELNVYMITRCIVGSSGRSRISRRLGVTCPPISVSWESTSKVRILVRNYVTFLVNIVILPIITHNENMHELKIII